MYIAKGYGFLAVLVWNRVSISTTLVLNSVCFLEETTSSSFGDKRISLLMFTPTRTFRNSLSRAPVTRRAQGLQVWKRVSNFWWGLKLGRENLRFWSEIG